jgi:hypothetical protein
MYLGGSFELRHPNKLDKLISRLIYSPAYAHKNLIPELDNDQKTHLSHLKRDGYVILEDYVPNDTLAIMQKELQQTLENLKFQMPCLAQSKINPERHSDLINNQMYGSTTQLAEMGLLFNRNEANNYTQVLHDFQPSTLTTYMLSYSEMYCRLWTDPYILGIIAHYLGMVPKLVEAYVRRNFPAQYRTMNHYWHRDLNSPFYLLKMFVFLSDCTLETGPHEYINGSHIDYSKLNNQRYFSDEQVDSFYPPTCAQRILSAVKAGTIILEDTRGLHRANVPVSGFRDLGYAVFMPLRPFYHHKNYKFPASTYQKLSSFQKAFIPTSCID